MLSVLNTLDTALTRRGLVRNSDSIEVAFDEQVSHNPSLSSVNDMFMGFHCSMSILSAPFDGNTRSFVIRNGQYSSAQEDWSCQKKFSPGMQGMGIGAQGYATEEQGISMQRAL